MFKALFSTVFLLWSSIAIASPLTATYVRDIGNRDTGYIFSGLSVDQRTGIVYQNHGYGPGPFATQEIINTYANVAAFEAGTANGSFANPYLYGTYFAANNGTLYGRGSDSNPVGTGQYTFPADAKAIAISARTGSLIDSTNIIGMGGNNGTDTFTWGGFSSLNAMYGGNELFYVGGVAENDNWMISRYDSALNSMGSVSFSLYQPGWSFAIGDYVYFGRDYQSGRIDTRVNGLTGEVSGVNLDVVFAKDLPYTYINNVAYDAAHDTLYLNSAGALFKIQEIGRALGTPSNTDVPEPITIVLFGSGLAGIAVVRRKQVKK